MAAHSDARREPVGIPGCPACASKAAEQDSADCRRHARSSQERRCTIRGGRPKSRSPHGLFSQSHSLIRAIADICLSQMGASDRHRTSPAHHPLCLIRPPSSGTLTHIYPLFELVVFSNNNHKNSSSSSLTLHTATQPKPFPTMSDGQPGYIESHRYGKPRRFRVELTPRQGPRQGSPCRS